MERLFCVSLMSVAPPFKVSPEKTLLFVAPPVLVMCMRLVTDELPVRFDILSAPEFAVSTPSVAVSQCPSLKANENVLAMLTQDADFVAELLAAVQRSIPT